MDSIMTLKYHFGFKFVHSGQILGQLVDKVFVLKLSIDIPSSGVKLVKRMYVRGDTENSWTMFSHVKCLQ